MHPGILHTDPDFLRMRTKLGEGAEPWKLAWNVLITSGHSNLSSDMMPNPLPVVIRGGDGQNFGTMTKDMQRAYQLALRWKVSQDDAYAEQEIRRRLHYVLPGETGYIVIDPGTAKQSRTDLEAADRPWYANVWDGVDKADAAADQ